VIISLDLVVISRDSSFVADYAQIMLPNQHLEVPLSVVAEPIHLDEIAEWDGVAVSATQIALDPAGRPTAHHSLDFSVVAAAPGLWAIALRARHLDPRSPEDVHEVESEQIQIVKR
jgi:hypothetical protein